MNTRILTYAALALLLIIASTFITLLSKQRDSKKTTNGSSAYNTPPRSNGMVPVKELESSTKLVQPKQEIEAEPDCAVHLASKTLTNIGAEDPKIACEAINQISHCDSRRSVTSILPALKNLTKMSQRVPKRALNSLNMTSRVLLPWWQSEKKEEQSKALDFAKFLAQPLLLPIFREAAKHSNVIFAVMLR